MIVAKHVPGNGPNGLETLCTRFLILGAEAPGGFTEPMGRGRQGLSRARRNGCAMTSRGLHPATCGFVLAMSAVLLFAGTAGAHERRQVGSYIMRVGWADEPTFVGVKNAVQLELSRTSGTPYTELPEGLMVVVIFGTQKTNPLPLVAAFGKRFGQPGDFRAAIIPTRPGNYTFHFVGALPGQRIDQSFTSSDTTFDPVQEATAIEFPAKDPSLGELAGKLDRLSARFETTQRAAREAAAAARQGRLVGGAGLLAGIAGIVLGLRACGHRVSTPPGSRGGAD